MLSSAAWPPADAPTASRKSPRIGSPALLFIVLRPHHTDALPHACSINCLLCRMFAGEDAPKTIELRPRMPQTQSIASFGGIAPYAKTDIAIARQRPDPITSR